MQNGREVPVVGETLSHYRILDKIGSGGMGEVYRAEDTSLRRLVALKVLPPHWAGSQDRLRRFQREAETLAALDHPNIVTIYTVEESEGVRFLTMQLLEGSVLSDLIPRGGMSLERIFEYSIPLADALAAAHGKGVIHRDLKPGNIMVTDEGWVKVLDFGLAKLRPEVAATESTDLPTEPLTEEGRILGTMPYMSPEQLEGRALDSRSDIFSLGVILFEMATGERPFKGDSAAPLISAIMRDSPRDVQTLREELPHHLGRIIRHCLEKDPERRFQAAKDVRNELEDLKRELLSEAILAGSSAAAIEVSRKRWLGAALAGLLALGMVGYGLWRGLAPGLEETVAPIAVEHATVERKMIVVLPFENLGSPEEEYFTAGMTEEVTSRLAGVSGLGVISRTSATQYDRAGKTVREIGQDLGVGHLLEGSVRWARSTEGASRVRITLQLIRVADDTHIWAESFDRVIDDVFDVQSEIAGRVLDAMGVSMLEPERSTVARRATDNLEAYDYFLRGNDYLDQGGEVDSEQLIQIAIQMYDEAVRLDPGFAQAFARLSLAHGFMHRMHFDRTEQRLASAKQAADRALELEPDSADGHLALGYFFRERLDLERALKEFLIVAEMQPSNGEVLAMMGGAQRSLGRWEEALTSLKRASELNPRVGSNSCSLGGVHLALRNYQEADFYHERASSLAPNRACAYFCQAWIYLSRDGSTSSARDFLERLSSNVGLEEIPPILYPWVMMDMIDGRYQEALDRLASGPTEALEFWFYYIPKAQLSAQIHGLVGHPQLERAHYEAARDMMEEKVRERPEDARFHSALGIAYAGLGWKQEAIRAGELAVDLLPVSKDRWLGPFRKKDLAHIYVEVGEYDAALEELEYLLANPTYYSTPLIRMDPTWNPLRNHPGFQALLEKYGVSTAEASAGGSAARATSGP